MLVPWTKEQLAWLRDIPWTAIELIIRKTLASEPCNAAVACRSAGPAAISRLPVASETTYDM